MQQSAAAGLAARLVAEFLHFHGYHAALEAFTSELSDRQKAGQQAFPCSLPAPATLPGLYQLLEAAPAAPAGLAQEQGSSQAQQHSQHQSEQQQGAAASARIAAAGAAGGMDQPLLLSATAVRAVGSRQVSALLKGALQMTDLMSALLAASSAAGGDSRSAAHQRLNSNSSGSAGPGQPQPAAPWPVDAAANAAAGSDADAHDYSDDYEAAESLDSPGSAGSQQQQQLSPLAAAAEPPREPSCRDVGESAEQGGAEARQPDSLATTDLAEAAGAEQQHQQQQQHQQWLADEDVLLLQAEVAAADSYGTGLLPAIDYDHLKALLQVPGQPVLVCRLLQALRWRLTRTAAGVARFAALSADLQADLLQQQDQQQLPRSCGWLFQVAGSPFVMVKAELCQLLHAMACDCLGRAYLTQTPQTVTLLCEMLLQCAPKRASSQSPVGGSPAAAGSAQGVAEQLLQQHAIATLQKLSVQTRAQAQMTRLGLMPWLVQLLAQSAPQGSASSSQQVQEQQLQADNNEVLPSDSSIGSSSSSSTVRPYAWALLLNLVMNPEGRLAAAQACGRQLIQVCGGALQDERNDQVRAYVHGVLFTMMGLPAMAAAAAAAQLPDKLQRAEQAAPPVFARQLQHVQRQLQRSLAALPPDTVAAASAEAECSSDGVRLPAALLELLPAAVEREGSQDFEPDYERYAAGASEDEAWDSDAAALGPRQDEQQDELAAVLPQLLQQQGQEQQVPGVAGSPAVDVPPAASSGRWRGEVLLCWLCPAAPEVARAEMELLKASLRPIRQPPPQPQLLGDASSSSRLVSSSAPQPSHFSTTCHLAPPADPAHSTWHVGAALSSAAAAAAPGAAALLPELSVAGRGRSCRGASSAGRQDWQIAPAAGGLPSLTQPVFLQQSGLSPGSPGAVAASQLQAMRASVVQQAEAAAWQLRGKLAAAGLKGRAVAGGAPASLASDFLLAFQPRRALAHSPR